MGRLDHVLEGGASRWSRTAPKSFASASALLCCQALSAFCWRGIEVVFPRQIGVDLLVVLLEFLAADPVEERGQVAQHRSERLEHLVRCRPGVLPRRSSRMSRAPALKSPPHPIGFRGSRPRARQAGSRARSTARPSSAIFAALVPGSGGKLRWKSIDPDGANDQSEDERDGGAHGRWNGGMTPPEPYSSRAPLRITICRRRRIDALVRLAHAGPTTLAPPTPASATHSRDRDHRPAGRLRQLCRRQRGDADGAARRDLRTGRPERRGQNEHVPRSRHPDGADLRRGPARRDRHLRAARRRPGASSATCRTSPRCRRTSRCGSSSTCLPRPMNSGAWTAAARAHRRMPAPGQPRRQVGRVLQNPVARPDPAARPGQDPAPPPARPRPR